jgi:hypothetical protein
MELSTAHALRVLAQEKVKNADGLPVSVGLPLDFETDSVDSGPRTLRASQLPHNQPPSHLPTHPPTPISTHTQPPTPSAHTQIHRHTGFTCSALGSNLSCQIRSDALSLQESLLKEISTLGSELGDLCVRRSHALTLAARGLSGTKGLSALECKIEVLEDRDIQPCEHEACLAESHPTRGMPPSSAIVSV